MSHLIHHYGDISIKELLQCWGSGMTYPIESFCQYIPEWIDEEKDYPDIPPGQMTEKIAIYGLGESPILDEYLLNYLIPRPYYNVFLIHGNLLRRQNMQFKAMGR